MIEHKFGLAFRAVDLSTERTFREMHAEVVFGTPSKHCTGAGICMVSTTGFNSRVITCSKAPAWISSDLPGTVLFRFEKTCIQANIVEGRFSQQEFSVEEAFHLPLRLVRQLGLASHWGQPGIYPIIEQESDWLLCFQLL